MVGVISIVNYSLDTFYNPQVIPAYSLGLDVTLILNTCLVPVMFYVVITQSKAVGSYKWYILNGICCDYAYDLLVSSWQPVPLFPCYMAYANGPFKNFIGQELSYIGLAVGVLIYVNMASNQLLAFLTRFSQVSPLQWAGYLKNARLIWPFIIFLHGIQYIIFVIPCLILVFMHFTKADIVQAILHECPVLEIFIDFPGFFGVPFSKVESVVMLIMAGFILGWGVISTFCSIFYYKSLKQWKETVTSSTYKLQRMLFFAMVAQTVNNWIFTILPLATAFIWSAERLTYSSYATMLGVFISSFHTIADIVVTLYFIRPYRACIIKFIRRLFTKFIRVHPAPQVANLEILPSNIHFSNQSEYVRVARLMRDQ